MKILFLHGWHSTPGGTKPLFLADHGHTVWNPSLCPEDFGVALETAQSCLEMYDPEIVVGSSRGGALAMNLKGCTPPMLLMCPAWKHWGDASKVRSDTILIHSEKDEVIPYSDSLELALSSGLPKTSLVSVGIEHRLASPEALKAMLDACHVLHSR